ncbi:MAG: YicC family protein [bacterium]|nr:YicC family protein [bacterium]
MTGFGNASFTLGGIAFEVEIRTVNHRHLDLRLKLPRQFAGCEGDVRARVPQHLGRGKVDLAVSLASGANPVAQLEIDQNVARQYVDAARALADEFDVPGTLDVTALIAMPGVTRFVEPGLEQEEVSHVLCDAVDIALAGVDTARLAEGASILADFEGRLGHVAELVESLDSRADLVREAAKERLRKRASQLELETGVIDEARLHQEIVIAADRLDVSEEIARLRSHIEQFHAIIAAAGPKNMVGRRLDFLLQELGREANTVGSKANDAPLAHDVVELKTELERIREQVQNIE